VSLDAIDVSEIVGMLVNSIRGLHHLAHDVDAE
jgi:hypothetical protein